MRSPSISVCNIALGRVRGGKITSIDEDSPEARACATHYDNCLQLLIEAHDWIFARQRVSLAPLSLNDRSDQWLYAYAVPDDMAQAVVMLWPLQSPLAGVFYPWPYLYPRPPFLYSDYVIAGTSLYSNVNGAVLEYVSRDPEEAVMPATFKNALAYALAAELAVELLDDRAKKGDLLQQAEAEKRRAMADDLNAYPRRDAPAIDEVALVRS